MIYVVRIVTSSTQSIDYLMRMINNASDFFGMAFENCNNLYNKLNSSGN